MTTPVDVRSASPRGPKHWARRVAKRVVRSTSGAFLRTVGASAPAGFTDCDSLVLAPHPDDETFGCGALIARKRAGGRRVTVVIAADGGESPFSEDLDLEQFTELRQHEALAALAELGVERDDVIFLGFADGGLADHIVDLADALGPILRERSPQQVLVTSIMDRHPDHAAVGRVGRLVTDRGDHAGDLLEYTIWQRIPAMSMMVGAVRSLGGRGSRPSNWPAQVAQLRPHLVSTDGHLDSKRAAVAHYPSQLPFLPLGFVEDFLRPVEVFFPVRRAVI